MNLGHWAVLWGAGAALWAASTAAVAGGRDYRWQDAVRWSPTPTWEWRGDDGGSAALRDVMRHTPDRFDGHGPASTAHETLHGLQAWMRRQTAARDAFLYDAQGRGAYVAEPRMALHEVAAYVPGGVKRMAATRFRMYLQDQARTWPETLYILDEWNAYVIGARTAVESHGAGRWAAGDQDAVDGAMDFLCFAAAAMHALSEREPAYFHDNEQLRGVFAMLAEKTMAWVDKGLAIPAFSGFHAAPLRAWFREAPENARLRAFLQAWLGATWTRRVLGF